MIKREDWQLEDQLHKMWAEGAQDEQPTKVEIDMALADCGFFAFEIDIHFDDAMGFWRWTANISKDRA